MGEQAKIERPIQLPVEGNDQKKFFLKHLLVT